MIYLTPYNKEGNIGKGINDAIKSLNCNDDDWICIMDGDIMFLNADWGKRIERTIEKFGNEYALFSCFTNRLNPNTMQHQLHNGICSDESDIRKHLEIYKEYPFEPEVNQVPKGKVIAGFLMIFQKKNWLKIGGFAEKTLHFDSDFSQRLMMKGLKIGVMTNLYVYHLYRLWNTSSKPQWDTKHLK